MEVSGRETYANLHGSFDHGRAMAFRDCEAINFVMFVSAALAKLYVIASFTFRVCCTDWKQRSFLRYWAWQAENKLRSSFQDRVNMKNIMWLNKIRSLSGLCWGFCYMCQNGDNPTWTTVMSWRRVLRKWRQEWPKLWLQTCWQTVSKMLCVSAAEKEDGCDARKWPRGAERTWKLSGRLLLCRPWTGTVDGGQGQGQWSGKSEQESQEELRMFLDDLSFVNSVWISQMYKEHLSCRGLYLSQKSGSQKMQCWPNVVKTNMLSPIAR